MASTSTGTGMMDTGEAQEHLITAVRIFTRVRYYRSLFIYFFFLVVFFVVTVVVTVVVFGCVFACGVSLTAVGGYKLGLDNAYLFSFLSKMFCFHVFSVFMIPSYTSTDIYMRFILYTLTPIFFFF